MNSAKNSRTYRPSGGLLVRDLRTMWRPKVAAASSRCAEAGNRCHFSGIPKQSELLRTFTCLKGHTSHPTYGTPKIQFPKGSSYLCYKTDAASSWGVRGLRDQEGMWGAAAPPWGSFRDPAFATLTSGALQEPHSGLIDALDFENLGLHIFFLPRPRTFRH